MRRAPLNLTAASLVGRLAMLLVAIMLAACSPGLLQAPPPTLMALAKVPTLDAPANNPAVLVPSSTPTFNPATPTNTPTLTPAPLFPEAVASSAPAESFAPPTLASSGRPPAVMPNFLNPTAPAVIPVYPTAPAPGMRAADAGLLFAAPVPSAAEILEWRPPPIPVPHSLHPHDHYWLRRPIPSGQVDWGLDWYPYGGNGGWRWRLHHGMDLPNDPGTPVLAAGDGTVIYVDDDWAPIYYDLTPTVDPTQPDLTPTETVTPTRRLMGPYGNYIIIQHDWGWEGQPVYTLYCHLLEVFVQEGDQVSAGDLIAGVGNTGNSTGPHLHFEVRLGENNYSSTRNPVLWIAPYEGWGTLAGRVTTARGTFWRNAAVAVYPVTPDGNYDPNDARVLTTYADSPVNPDDNWGENFVVPDLPAGEYLVVVKAGREVLRANIEIRQGATTFVRLHTSSTNAPLPRATATQTPTPGP